MLWVETVNTAPLSFLPKKEQYRVSYFSTENAPLVLTTLKLKTLNCQLYSRRLLPQRSSHWHFLLSRSTLHSNNITALSCLRIFFSNLWCDLTPPLRLLLSCWRLCNEVPRKQKYKTSPSLLRRESINRKVGQIIAFHALATARNTALLIYRLPSRFFHLHFFSTFYKYKVACVADWNTSVST